MPQNRLPMLVTGRTTRITPGGLTLALVLAAALAGLSGESAGRSGERLARAAKPLEAVAALALGCGFSATTHAATPLARSAGEAQPALHPAHPAVADALTRPARDASARGETDLPPPAVI